MGNAVEQNRFSERYVNLAHPRLGAKPVYVTDDFFADCARILKEEPAVFIPGKFDDHGKWMDGWESRRKRVKGYDYCVVRLGRAGVIHGVDIDTSHFKGNHPPAASIDACMVADGDPGEDAVWTEILPSVSLEEDAHHLFDVPCDKSYSHIRLNIYPDGGIARLRVYGEPNCNWEAKSENELLDLAALEYGGMAIACSNQGFGSSMLKLNMPGRGINMGDGWETARRRGPGNDWVVIKLGHPGVLKSIELDTAHYKGNYPDRASVQGGIVDGGSRDSIETQSVSWRELLPEQILEMDAILQFDREVIDIGPITHVRVNIIPDGGLSRVRLYGNIARSTGSK